MRLSAAQVAARVLEALEMGERIVTAVVVDATDKSMIGRRWWLCGRRSRGTLGSLALDAMVAAAAPSLFPSRESRGALSREFTYGEGEGDETALVYLELHGPPARMVIVGAGHIAVPLAQMGAMLGMRVEVLDDRAQFAAAERFPDADAVRVIDFRNPFAATSLGAPDHVILVTVGHIFDYECLVRLLRMEDPPGYIGMIGSRRRVRATHEQLVREGFTTTQMKRVRAPVGLDLGGQTPAEIAVAVVAEIILVHAGGTGAPLVDKERVVDRFFGGEGDALGRFVVVMVGAMIVAGIRAVWDEPGREGRLRPPERSFGGRGPQLEAGAELGRFELGSTVIVLSPPETIKFAPGLGERVQMGQKIGALLANERAAQGTAPIADEE